MIGASAIAIIALLGLLYWMLRRRRRTNEGYLNSRRGMIDLNSEVDLPDPSPAMIQMPRESIPGGAFNSTMSPSSFIQAPQDEYSRYRQSVLMPSLENLYGGPFTNNTYAPYGGLDAYGGQLTSIWPETPYPVDGTELSSPTTQPHHTDAIANPLVIPPGRTSGIRPAKADLSPAQTTRTTEGHGNGNDLKQMHRELEYAPVTNPRSTFTSPPDYHEVSVGVEDLRRLLKPSVLTGY